MSFTWILNIVETNKTTILQGSLLIMKVQKDSTVISNFSGNSDISYVLKRKTNCLDSEESS